MRRTTGAVSCPNCGRLVAATEPRCPFCDAWQPGLFGFGPWLHRTFGVFDLTQAITVACVVLYVASLLLDPSAFLHWGGFMDWLAPTSIALFSLGMTGGPMSPHAAWWTLCTAIFLHGSLLHIAFNMVIMRRFLPMVEHLYGPARAFVVFMVAGAVGFVCSDLAHPSTPTIGASGAIFGLLAALVTYGWRTGQRQATSQIGMMALIMFAYGLFTPAVDNFAHLGGFVGGLGASMLMPTSRVAGGDRARRPPPPATA